MSDFELILCGFSANWCEFSAATPDGIKGTSVLLLFARFQCKVGRDLAWSSSFGLGRCVIQRASIVFSAWFNCFVWFRRFGGSNYA